MGCKGMMAGMSDFSSPSAAPAPGILDALGHSMADKRIEVLRRLAHNGSISQAARDCGISYKAAWQALDTLTNLAGVTLVERSVGGAGGGGASLTEAGHTLLRAADAMEQARAEVLARMQACDLNQPALARLAVHTSMRNQWPCTVQSLEQVGARVTVHLQLGGTRECLLQSQITRESAELLGLTPGLPVLAMAKATAVWMEALPVSDHMPHSDDATTFWAAEVTHYEGADEEVAVRLASGLHAVGFVRKEHALQPGAQACVCVPHAAVVLARVQSVI